MTVIGTSGSCTRSQSTAATIAAVQEPTRSRSPRSPALSPVPAGRSAARDDRAARGDRPTPGGRGRSRLPPSRTGGRAGPRTVAARPARDGTGRRPCPAPPPGTAVGSTRRGLWVAPAVMPSPARVGVPRASDGDRARASAGARGRSARGEAETRRVRGAAIGQRDPVRGGEVLAVQVQRCHRSWAGSGDRDDQLQLELLLALGLREHPAGAPEEGVVRHLHADPESQPLEEGERPVSTIPRATPRPPRVRRCARARACGTSAGASGQPEGSCRNANAPPGSIVTPPSASGPRTAMAG